ncbi:MAG TPA: glycosyltransferase family 9 protein [Gammaproteobacteria bacterium]
MNIADTRATALRILVVRNDKLGDFMLAWPAFALIKRYLPEAQVAALVPEYTAPMARLCPFIDEVLLDERSNGARELARQLRKERFDVLLTLFSTSRVAMAGWLAGIRYRLAPATKIAQLFYNQRLTQRRSRSQKPEYAYNLDLVWRMLADHGVINSFTMTQEQDGDWLPPEITRPLLRFSDDRRLMKQAFYERNGVEISRKLVFIHAGSGGSATNLHPEQYAQLANLLSHDNALAFVISAGPGEGAVARNVANAINAPAVIYEAAGLAEFAHTLQLADLFISGSTGPLHIAGALDRPTAAFYPGHRSATPLRWQTLNAPAQRLAFTPPAGADQHAVAAIDIEAAAHTIRDHFFATTAAR